MIAALALALVVAVPLATTSAVWVPRVYGAAFSPAVPLVIGLCCAGVLQSLDYLLAHECLMSPGGRHLVALCRLPSVAVLVAGYALVHADWLPVLAVPVVPMLGYAASSALFMVAARLPVPVERVST